MLKRISPSQVELGMFVHKLEGSWLKHPFWKNQFILDDAATLADLKYSEVDAVVIDIAKGCDVTPPRREESAPRAAIAPAGLPQRRRFVPPSEPAQFDYRSTAPQPLAREFGHATRLAERGRKIVSKVFLEARLGKAVKAETVEPVIEDIFASIQRNPHAFNGLMRCKRDHEFLYRHALASSALMVSLARQLRLAPSEVREAGMAGLLFDVGINHLPVDLDAIGGDLRRLPIEVAAQHTELGYNFLIASGIAEPIALAARHHHERNNGSGYPMGLIGGDIPLLSRMAAVCDAYDQLASAGSDGEAVDPGQVVQRMADMHGQFDPVVFAAFVQSMGAYPIGSIVELRSGRLAMVIDQDSDDHTRPKVRTFFSLQRGERIRSEDIELSRCFGADELVGPADLSIFDPEDVLELRQKMMAGLAKGR